MFGNNKKEEEIKRLEKENKQLKDNLRIMDSLNKDKSDMVDKSIFLDLPDFTRREQITEFKEIVDSLKALSKYSRDIPVIIKELEEKIKYIENLSSSTNSLLYKKLYSNLNALKKYEQGIDYELNSEYITKKFYKCHREGGRAWDPYKTEKYTLEEFCNNFNIDSMLNPKKESAPEFNVCRL